MTDPEAMHATDEQLHAYLDGGLDPSDHARIQAHLAQCQHCQDRLEAIRALFSAIEGLPEEPLGRDLTPEVLDAIRPQIRWPARVRILVAAELLLALILLAIAWPRAATWEALPDLAQSLSGIELTWQAISREAVGSMIGLWDRTIQLVQAVAGEWMPPGFPTMTVPLLWSAIVGALALWLAGNGALLRRDLYSRSKE